MLIRIPRGFEIAERDATPEAVYRGRRRFLKRLGLAGIAAGLPGCASRTSAAGPPEAPLAALAAKRNPAFRHEGDPSDETPTRRYNNFYEFTQDKDVWRYVEKYETRPFTLEIGGLVQKPRTYDIDEILKLPLEERLYRHRCVEAWYMDVPWIGVPLHELIAPCEPLPKARFVRFVSVLKKDEMPGQKSFSWYRWPYYEGLALGEAMNELTLATVGVYGHELPKQNGAALRIVVPWKYGYKGPKAVVRIELVEKQPRTFWNDLQPDEYGFESNVNPAVPHPRWSQASERAIDGGKSRKTRLYNGYAEWVGHLYKS